MSRHSLKKIGQRVLKLEQGNEALTDRWMDTQNSEGTIWSYIYICQCICKILLKFIYPFLRYSAKMHTGIGHESRAITMLFLKEIVPLAIPYHSSPIPMSMQCICKILLKFLYSFLRYWPKLYFGHKSRAITLLFLNEIIPLAIPYHSSPIPMSLQSLKKIGKNVLKLEQGNEAQSIFDIHQGP